MYYKIRGYNNLKPERLYTDVVYNKGEKNTLIKQYKEYLKNEEIDMFEVVSYLNNGKLKDIVTYA